MCRSFIYAVAHIGATLRDISIYFGAPRRDRPPGLSVNIVESKRDVEGAVPYKIINEVSDKLPIYTLQNYKFGFINV